MGRYHPPDGSDPNKLHKKRPPGVHGIDNKQTVRFEMPFNILCTHCDNQIAQGVRFNAVKKKAGMYHSTPVWAFEIKHTVCQGRIVVRTDPKRTDYEVVEGGKRVGVSREGGEKGELKIKPPWEMGKEEGGMEKLERTKEEERVVRESKGRIEGLLAVSERQWGDPYERSRELRRVFRVGGLSFLLGGGVFS